MMKQRIIDWICKQLGIDARLMKMTDILEKHDARISDLLNRLEYPELYVSPLNIWYSVRENEYAIQYLKEHTLPDVTTEPVLSELFDPKVEPYPTHFAGSRVGYVTVKEDVALWYPDKDRVLMPYENAAWASNTLGKRITVKASRKATMVYAYGRDKHYDLPWPTEFDGGTRAYLVMNEQLIDGHDLTSFEHPKLYIKAADVAESWVVEVVG